MANAEEKYEELSKQVELLRADLARVTETVGELARAEVDEGRERVRGAAQEAVVRGRRMRDAARRQADEGLHEAADYVRERPFGAVAVAAALGMVFGFLTARK
jgi:ElaB/YqjD/DUF883 family membrane-anchored ribosome-binding protein